jgi:electron transfer flavoprotein beta subunit
VKVVVLVKQVPDTETKIKLLADGSSYDPEGIKWVMNPYDEYAVEEALRIKEAGKATEVITLTLGPDSALERIRTALAMGADRAVHIKESYPNVSDATVVAGALAAALKGLDAGLILAGKQAVDDDGYSVPGMVAALLGAPHVNACSKVEAADDKVTAWADIEGGAKLVMECRLPVVVTATKGLNEPRYASLPGIMKAKKKPVETKSFADLGVSAAPKTEILGWTLPDERAPGRVLKGEVPDQVKELVKALREEAKVI